MRILLKIVKISVATLVSGIALLLVISAILEPQISKIFIQKVNQGLNTRAEVGKINFSLLRNFPQASVDLSDLVVYSPVKANVAGDADTLLSAGHLFVSLKITGLIRNEYIIDKIRIEKGRINISENIDGKTNLDIFKSTGKADSSALSIELRSIRIEESYLHIKSSLRNIETLLYLTEADNRVSLAPSEGTVNLNATLNIILFRVKDYLLPPYEGRIKTSADLSFNSKAVQFERFSLDCNETAVRASGKVGLKGGEISADFILSPTNIPDMLGLAGLAAAEKAEEYGLNGTVSATGNINKPGIEGDPAEVNILFSLGRGRVSVPGARKEISDITATGAYSFKIESPATTSLVKIDKLTASTGSSRITAAGTVKNLYSPQVDIEISGDIETSDVASLVKLEKIKIEGVVRSNIRLYGSIPHKKKSSLLKTCCFSGDPPT
ncbi:MAG: hypothetical protein R2744_04970 [Bacteroidales bacterium]